MAESIAVGCDCRADTANITQADRDVDGVGDVCDLCPNAVPAAPVDADGCPDPSIPGDFDHDGDVDQDDVNAFETCASGPAVTLTPGCEDKDVESGGDGDQSDFAIVQRCFSDQNCPAEPTCAD